MCTDLGPARALQSGDNLTQCRHSRTLNSLPRKRGRVGVRAWVRAGARLGPDQRHRLGEVADEIPRPAEQFRIDPRHRQIAHLAGLRLGERQFAGQRRQGPAALRVRRGHEIFLHQPQFAVARRREQQRVEQLGEAVHARAPTGHPIGQRIGSLSRRL